MLNPERVDIKNPEIGIVHSNVEIEFTTENADSALIIELTSHDAMRLANMIMDKCSYAAQKKEKY